MKKTFQSNDRLLTWNDLKKIIPYSRQHIYRMMEAKAFPQRIRLSESRVAWLERDIHDWISARM